MQEPPTITCGGGYKARIIQGCHCDEFRPYRIATITEEDEEVIEKQYSEVKNII
jgi:hypothetical protein